MRHADRNYPLYLGLALALVIALLAVFGARLAPHNPLQVHDLVREGDRFLSPPFRPFELRQFPLGTDHIGRDLLSRILWGVRPTLVLALAVVAIRLLLGVPLGLLAGWYRGRLERAIDVVISAAIAMPILIFSLAAIALFGIGHDLLPFIAALSLTGWADLAAFVKNRTQSIAQAPYIDSARAVGVPAARLLMRYVAPQLWPALPALVAFELGAVVLLAAELGFLGVYIGGGFVYGEPRGDSAGVFLVLTSGYPELGQLLSDVWAKLLRAPWDPLLVGALVVLTIFSFNMLGEGLRRRMDVTRARPTRR